jgi:hypothetical protein
MLFAMAILHRRMQQRVVLVAHVPQCVFSLNAWMLKDSVLSLRKCCRYMAFLATALLKTRCVMRAQPFVSVLDRLQYINCIEGQAMANVMVLCLAHVLHLMQVVRFTGIQTGAAATI